MGQAAEDAKKYLTTNEIPKIFEALMTGLMYQKPAEPIDFMLAGLMQIKQIPKGEFKWDMFIDNTPEPFQINGQVTDGAAKKKTKPLAKKISKQLNSVTEAESGQKTPPPPHPPSDSQTQSKTTSRVTTPMRARDNPIPQVPIFVLFGGPGGEKTRHAAKVVQNFQEDGMVHISMPDLVHAALDKYGTRFKSWKDAKAKYEAGDLLSDDQAVGLMKAEMAKYPDAQAFLLEGFPRTIAQVESLERDGARVEMAIIIDYDENELKTQSMQKGRSSATVRRRLEEFQAKTLPACKFYDDRFMLHLVPGEQIDEKILEDLTALINSILHPNSNPAIGQRSREPEGVQAQPNEPPTLIIIGAPGSLKTEYAKRISQRYDGFVQIGMGELLRRKAADNAYDPEWLQAIEAMDKGEPVSNELCKQLLEEAIQAQPSQWGYVIEGFPRDIDQAEDFEQNHRVDFVLLIDCTEQFCIGNLRKRSESSEKRSDDTPAAVKQRILMFKQRTLPMLKHFDEQDKLKVVEGDKATDQVFQDIVNMLDSALFLPNDSNGSNSLGES